MNAHRLLPVGEEGPLHAAQLLIGNLWDQASLDALLIPSWQDSKGFPKPRLLADSAHIELADPFAPFMPHNSASEAITALERFQGKRLALAMRPCEMVSYRALAKAKGLDADQALLISTDCLSAFEVDDTRWRSDTRTDPQQLTEEALHFAAQGGILASRYRGSCQFCEQIVPEDIDIHIGVLGLETSKHMLVSIYDPGLEQGLTDKLALVTDVPGDISQRRERVLKNLATWRKRTWEQALANLDTGLLTLDALDEHLVSCTACSGRLSAQCPTFETAWSGRSAGERRSALSSWIASCGGCGTCEHACPEDYPLFTTIRFLKHAKVN